MGNDFLQLGFSVLALVLGAGCEDLLPSVLGIGFPVLLVSAQVLAVRGTPTTAYAFAVAAGAAEDALSGLAPMTSVGFFLLAAILARRLGTCCRLTSLTYPCYQLWLAVWTGGLNVFSRILLAFPVGLLTAAAVGLVLSWAIRWGAIDERG